MDRVAVYFAPAADHAAWRFGSSVLGYDAATGGDTPFPGGLPVPPALWSDFTSEPRRYGFHATLKAPFSLRAGASSRELDHALDGFAASRAPVLVPRLDVRLLGSFAALVPSETSPALDALASACVEALEPLRAPLTEVERGRRLAARLTERQITYLDLYGYPYVHEEFRFHMTLTGPLPGEEAEPVRSWLARHYEASVAPGLLVDAICLFGQDTRHSRFTLQRRVPLRG